MRGFMHAAVAIALTAVAACGPSAPGVEPSVIANAIRVSSHEAARTLDVVGIVQPYQQSDLRGRVSGLVTARFFQGGQGVKTGDLLYTIDPTQYQENIANARADLAQAKAAYSQSSGDVTRYGSLLKQHAVAGQIYDQAVSVAAQNAAVVAARQTALQLAKLALSYTKIVSPIAGQIDTPSVDVGSLVTAGQTLLGTVSTLDPVYVEFSVPEGAAIAFALQHNLPATQAAPSNMPPVTMVLPNGTIYPQTGKIGFAARTIATTGTLTIRAIFQNPARILRPGLNIRVRVQIGGLPHALLIPQRAIGDLLGRKYVFVAGANHIVEQRMVTLGPVVGDLQVVADGLKHGETVIVDGLQFVKIGQPIKVKIVPLESSGAG
jgi:membrane fusion protein (multidrug efflux system)